MANNLLFDLVAPLYNRIIRAPDPRTLRGLLDLPARGWLLDIGGGTGRVAQVLGPLVDRVVVCDRSRRMLKAARQAPGENGSAIHPAQASVERLPFADGQFARIMMVDAFHHFSDQPGALRELARLLAPGGRLVIEEPDYRRFGVKLLALGEKIALMGSRFHRPAEIARMAAKQGLTTWIDVKGSTAWIMAEKPRPQDEALPEVKLLSVQGYLRENARSQYDSAAFPPFTAFFHPSDPNPYFSYAIPDETPIGDPRQALEDLRAEFERRGRKPRFEYLEASSPWLEEILLRGGFREETRQWCMVCTPETLTRLEPVAGLEIVELNADSPDADIRDYLIAQRQGFNPDNISHPGVKAIRQARRDFSLGGWSAFLGRLIVALDESGAPVLPGEPAAAGCYGRIIEGVTEVAGIATRLPFRRRGIAGCLTEHMTVQAFQRGARVACLTAADEAAGRVYERCGFKPFSTMLAYAYLLETGES